MPSLSKELDQLLLDLAWSLWTELGVAGVIRKHRDFLINLEELILLTVVLADADPRLRDESLDWCSQYYRFISITRLKSLIKNYDDSLKKSFSVYSATLNSLSRASWPLFVDSVPLHCTLSHKSCLRPLESPALLNIRTRSIFGTGTKADLIAYFLTHSDSDYSGSDLSEIGYSKRNLVESLDEFCLAGLFEKYLLRNQQRYRLSASDHLIKALGPIPKHALSWGLMLEIIFPLRDCIKRTEKNSDSTKVVEIRNILNILQKKLQRLKLSPPPFQSNFNFYLESFSAWILDIVRKLAHGESNC